MEVSFTNDGGAATPAPVIDTQATVTPAPADATNPNPPAVRAPSQVAAPSGLVLGDKLPEFKDIILPRLNLVQNIGQLKDSFTPGSIVFGQNAVLYCPQENDPKTGNCKVPASPPVRICVLGFRPTRYVEAVEGGAGRGLICNTEAEVRANGGTMDYQEWKLKKAAGMKRFQPLAEAVIAIERPEICADDDTVFVYTVAGKKVAIGLWAMKGTSYTAAAKRVFFTARAMGCLTKGYPTRIFSLTTREESFNGTNKAWVPVCLPIEKTSEEFLAFVAGVLNPPEAE